MFIKNAGSGLSDVEIESEYQFERRMFGSNPEQLDPRCMVMSKRPRK